MCFLQDPKATTAMIYEAATVSGKRILLSSGWAKLGVDVPNKPESVFILGNCPHSWLFSKCSAVVHHGGAGTTAAALRAALPTLVVCHLFSSLVFMMIRCFGYGRALLQIVTEIWLTLTLGCFTFFFTCNMTYIESFYR
jgi:UDP:flavonoid glycosyltransferase YjiC (YdhE family)